jgi:hypothetical protein
MNARGITLREEGGRAAAGYDAEDGDDLQR